MLILLTSPGAIAPNGVPNQAICESLIKIRANNIPVGVTSNHPEPKWFEQYFSGSGVEFVNGRGRQSGRLISINAEHFKLSPHNVLVLAGNLTDIQMAKNGGAILMGAGWLSDPKVNNLGISVSNSDDLSEVILLVKNWTDKWWTVCNNPLYSIKALSDLSGYNQSFDQQEFARKVTHNIKNGGNKLNALLTITARSLLADRYGEVENLMWGVYPSSSSANDDSEVLSNFTHRLRTTVSRVRYAKVGEPLFIRHTPSVKRSSGASMDRYDPSSQVLTLYLNPFYKNKIHNRNVVIIDDCTTYGVSFGVASAFLKSAGANTVTCVALGKFGNVLNYYDISITSDPFSKVDSSGFTVNDQFPPQCTKNQNIKDLLHQIIP